jgi:hypothetical protein
MRPFAPHERGGTVLGMGDAGTSESHSPARRGLEPAQTSRSRRRSKREGATREGRAARLSLRAAPGAAPGAFLLRSPRRPGAARTRYGWAQRPPPAQPRLEPQRPVEARTPDRNPLRSAPARHCPAQRRGAGEGLGPLHLKQHARDARPWRPPSSSTRWHRRQSSSAPGTKARTRAGRRALAGARLGPGRGGAPSSPRTACGVASARAEPRAWSLASSSWPRCPLGGRPLAHPALVREDRAERGAAGVPALTDMAVSQVPPAVREPEALVPPAPELAPAPERVAATDPLPAAPAAPAPGATEPSATEQRPPPSATAPSEAPATARPAPPRPSSGTGVSPTATAPHPKPARGSAPPALGGRTPSPAFAPPPVRPSAAASPPAKPAVGAHRASGDKPPTASFPVK